jgi:hypothetical protein
LATYDETIDKEEDYRADHATNETGRLSGLIPADTLAEVSCDERAYNSLVVRIKPFGSLLSPGTMNLAITPTMKPMMIVQRMLISFLPFLNHAPRKSVLRSGLSRTHAPSH